MEVYFNGSMMPAEEARVSVEDAGFTHAVGLFETMLARQGKVFRLEEHLGRLLRSAEALSRCRDLDITVLGEAVLMTLEENGLAQARVRLTVTAGEVSLLKPAKSESKTISPTILVVATPPTEYDPKYFEQGITVLMAPAGANPFDAMAGHKTLSYWGRLRTLRQAASVGAGEAIWLNVTNHLAGGAVSNLFIIKDGSLLTPIARGEEDEGSLPAPVLPGVTRAAILQLAGQMSVPTYRRMLTINDLLEADEAFLTNSSWGVLPVSRVEKKIIGKGSTGPLTMDLRLRLMKLIDAECTA
ncbi:MAG: aminotransferase class IV family protein [Phycisphaeraceae bacterium]|nr:aminotransferase class IV family protein [Phycisphaeraceae bacterium]